MFEYMFQDPQELYKQAQPFQLPQGFGESVGKLPNPYLQAGMSAGSTLLKLLGVGGNPYEKASKQAVKGLQGMAGKNPLDPQRSVNRIEMQQRPLLSKLGMGYGKKFGADAGRTVGALHDSYYDSLIPAQLNAQENDDRYNDQRRIAIQQFIASLGR